MTSGKRFAAAIYNPHLLERSDLIAAFVARRPLLNELLDDLRRGGGQHHLLIGARGAGKTTLLLRLAYAIEDDAKLARKCIALRFPEEQYNISRLSDFWMNCIDALTDALEQRGDHSGAVKLDTEVKDLEAVEEGQRAPQALALLTNWAKRTKVTLVLLIDNLDIVLGRLHDFEWPLRETLSADNGLAVIGASSAILHEALAYESAFYDFFHIHELGPLAEDEARELVLELAKQAQAPEVETIVRSDPGRFKALYVLTGGMPRTLVLLQGILAAGESSRVEEDLERLLDQLTPYYKARFEDLPTQSQLIVNTVALHWHPMTAAECASHTQIGINVVSAQLDRLCRQGVLSKVSLSETGKLGFQMAERFFNIWYLMRASRRLRRRLRWLVEFLRVFYGDRELRLRAETLLATTAGQRAIAGGTAKLFAFASAIDEPALRRQLELRAIHVLLEECRRMSELREFLDLEGEDAHLAPVVDRARALREVRANILKAKVRWPKGMTAKRYAEELACDPLVPIRHKLAVAEALTGDPSKKRDLLGQELPGSGLRLDPRVLAAIGRGDLPSLTEFSRPEEVDHFLTLSARSEDVLAPLFVMGDGITKTGFPDAVVLRAIEVSGIAARRAIFLSAMLWLDKGAWPLARRRAAQMLGSFGSSDDTPVGIVHLIAQLTMFCQTCLKKGLGKEAIELLKETGMDERLSPFHEALCAAITPEKSLSHLSPEIRAPAEEILKLLVEDAPRGKA
jgi:energy-coupling factor transporter ATP-binding protein EcfA2